MAYKLPDLPYSNNALEPYIDADTMAIHHDKHHQAYVNNLRNGRPRPNLYILPCTLSYKLVLEAETLIEDHLNVVHDTQKAGVQV